MTRLAVDPRAGRLFVAAHTRTKTSQPKVIYIPLFISGCHSEGEVSFLIHYFQYPLHGLVQGTIYIYTMGGVSVNMLNAKIGVVSGLTLDPVKQVFNFKCTR